MVKATLKDVVERAGEILEKDSSLPKDVMEAYTVAVFKAIFSFLNEGTEVALYKVGKFKQSTPYKVKTKLMSKPKTIRRTIFKPSKSLKEGK